MESTENKNLVPDTVFQTIISNNKKSWAKGDKIKILSSYDEDEKPGCATSFVELIDVLGSDLTVVNAARVSFGKEKETLDMKDESLIRFLARHNHWTPFSQPQLQFRFKMPAFVARQYFKHTVGLTRNEISRRYVNTAPEFWLPKNFRESADNVKQGSADTVHEDNILITDMVYQNYKDAALLYETLIKSGVCAEQARAVLPMGFLVEFIETGSLAAYMRIIGLRRDKSAQKEIQDFAIAIDSFIQKHFPKTWQGLEEVRKTK